MILSETPKRSNSRWLQACVLLCATAVFPVGVTYAQDYGAVEKRLGEAVSKGELSLRQAAAMMDALREAAGDGDKDNVERRFGEWIGSVGEKLKAAVKAGKLSEEDAWKKWHYFKENELAPKLKAAVASGKLSEQWALSAWKSLEKADVGERLKAAVAKRQMTADQAKQRWEGYLNRAGGAQAKTPSREEMADEYGVITGDQGNDVLAGRRQSSSPSRSFCNFRRSASRPRPCAPARCVG